MSARFTMFRITVDGDARAWADAHWDTYGFDFDTELTGGNVIHAWALDDGPDAADELARALTADAIRFVTFEANADELWPDARQEEVG